MKARILVCSTTAVLMLSAFGQLALAEMLPVPFVYEFSGAYPPHGETPWLTATFTDSGPESVTMELDLDNLVDMEYLGMVLFNLDPALDPTNLSFGEPIKNGSFLDPVISTGVDVFNGDGAHGFDIKFDFALSNPQQSTSRFGPGESMAIEISGDSLTAGSFDFLNGGQGPKHYIAAAHVQGIGDLGESSGWVTVPEPSAMGYLLSLTALGWFVAGWRKYRRRAVA